MRLRFSEDGFRAELSIGIRSLREVEPAIDALRLRTGQAGDPLCSLQRLIPWCTMHGDLPAAMLLSRGAELCAVILLTLRRRRGLPVGFAVGGNLAGQGSIIADPADRIAMLETTARVLLRRGLAHTVRLSALIAGDSAPGRSPPAKRVRGEWQFREVRLSLDLAGGVPAVMERLSYKMRRNLRYYRRRAQDKLGWVFVSDMAPEQKRHAVAMLHAKGPYPMPARQAWRTVEALNRMPGHFAMGLHDPTGAWVSYVTGWRADGVTYVDWQLNCVENEAASVSTVMRAHLLEHEAERGSLSLVFVGMTAPFWAKACEPHVCADLVAVGRGPVGSLVLRLTKWLSPHGQVSTLLGKLGQSGETAGADLEDAEA